MVSSRFKPLSVDLDFAAEEREIRALWNEQDIFRRTLEASAGRPNFVFYEGPPTANGVPHNGHVLTRVMKDIFPRYKTMCGYHVPRRAGWDTHGLPVEVEVEKSLRIHGKAAIEEFGVGPFIKECMQSVFTSTGDWTRMSELAGLWVDFDEAYVTYHKRYVESVWWALSELFKKGLLYQGYKVVWWWAQGGTALSASEVGKGYRQVDDPSVYVRFPLVDFDGASLLVWTTTPWTLPSNAYVAVHPKQRYVVVVSEEDRFVVARDLVEPLAKKLKRDLTVVRELDGSELVGAQYVPPFEVYRERLGDRTPYWKVIEADFVTLDTGTGIVHIAPAFGEDDFNVHRRVLEQAPDLPLLNAVNPDGTFNDDFPRYAGKWVKGCDKEIQHELKDRGLLVHAETYRHEYPFCWRAENDALIQYARPAWYIRTTEKIHDAIANNRAIQWLPENTKEGRMGDFLANNVDWAVSRERYWGTPLNIWVNDVTGRMLAPASVEEILQKNPRAFDHFEEARKEDPTLDPHLIVHKPWIDQVTWQEPGEEGTYRRVRDVIDCWFDSGCMPFAQWGFPHHGVKEFLENFPADFISEGIDQTRGWFYSLLMVSTLLFDEECQKRIGMNPVRSFPHPFKTCVVLGHILDREGKKESKSKGNYTSPDVIFEAVRIESAVADPADLALPSGTTPLLEGEAFIAPETLEGLDLVAGASVEVTRSGGGPSLMLKLRPLGGMDRRAIALHAEDRVRLEVTPTTKRQLLPSDVPRLPERERVTVHDLNSSAPGADAFRWFFYSSSPPWNATRHSLSNVRKAQKETLIKLRNVYSFFTIYANIDDFDPIAHSRREKPVASELDRWILDLLGYTTKRVREELDRFQVFEATNYLIEFVDALSNWYLRRSRERFWKSGWDEDKESAYVVLYDCLTTTARLFAPFTPFLSESMYQNLVVRQDPTAPPSVHLTSYPDRGETFDDALRNGMQAVRDVVSLGLQVRTQAKLKVRQPLRLAKILAADSAAQALLPQYEAMIRDELNVLTVEFIGGERARDFVEYKLKPNFRTLGQRGLGREAQALKQTFAKLSVPEAAEILQQLSQTGTVTISDVALRREDLEVSFVAKPGFAAAGDRVGVVVLETALDETLIELGFLRELQNRAQTARKDLGLAYADRIRLTLSGGERTKKVVDRYGADLAREVLATEVLVVDAPPPDAMAVEVEEETVHLALAKV